MFDHQSCWEYPCFRETLNGVVDMDLHAAEKVVDALPRPGSGQDRATRIRLMLSTVAAFVGDRRPHRPLRTDDGGISTTFLTFAVKNFRAGRNPIAKDLHRQLIEVAKARGISVPRSVERHA